MAAADVTRGQPSRVPSPHTWDPMFEQQQIAYKSNVSQTEYLYKHRLFFEDIRRAETRRRRREGVTMNDLPIQRIHTFHAAGEKTWTANKGELVRSVDYEVDIPNYRNSITNVDSVELHLQIIPTECLQDRQVTIRVLQQEEKKVYVDACRPRWESLSVFPLFLPSRTLNITCLDCAAKSVTFTAPHLNLITSSTKKTRHPRRVPMHERRRCRLSPLVIDFKQMPSFKSVTSPRKVDIGRCRGSCLPDYLPHSQHAFFRYDLARIGKGPMPCCAPSKYKDLEYLMPTRTRLQKYSWKDAIAIHCTCH